LPEELCRVRREVVSSSATVVATTREEVVVVVALDLLSATEVVETVVEEG